jgi:hypothetical protein
MVVLKQGQFSSPGYSLAGRRAVSILGIVCGVSPVLKFQQALHILPLQNLNLGMKMVILLSIKQHPLENSQIIKEQKIPLLTLRQPKLLFF